MMNSYLRQWQDVFKTMPGAIRFRYGKVFIGVHIVVMGQVGFIAHELCHVYLFTLGFTPVFERAFKDRELPAYCSVEWQAKCLCGELLVPYEESQGMTRFQIVQHYKVSWGFADTRLRIS